MKTITRKLRMWLLVVLSALCIGALALGLTACVDKSLKIDVPERIEADLGTGTYVVPHYDVVNEYGMIMAGYTVKLESATDPNGEPALISEEASTIVTLSGAGEYTFVYTADGVPDATVIMDFADRTAPTIKLASSQFPAFFIKNVTYAVPEYTLGGDFVASKCYTKVYYNSGEGEDEEVTLNDGSFKVEHEAGKYTIHIHVEDAAGNGNDYRYTRSVNSPEHYDPNTVIYFNEAFGEKQVSPEGDYAGKYVSVAEGGKAYGEEAGSYKVVFDGSETHNNEAYFVLNVPAIANIMGYKELEMYVYIEDADCPNEKTQWVVGSKWWNDTPANSGEWTRVTWSVENWGKGIGANCGTSESNIISSDNITGTRIRLIPDGIYEDKKAGTKTPAPHGTVYFSAMRAIPWDPSQITAGDEYVTLDHRDGSYHVGDTVTLTAKEQSGKTFDCFLVDDTPIGGNTFVASQDKHTVTTKYIDGENALTAENMTWGETDTYQTAGSDAKAQKLGSDTHWVLTYQPEFEADGWVYTAAYVGGKDQLFGIEMNSDGDAKKLSGYGGAWKGDVALPVSETVRDLLRASKTTPVTMIYVRNGDMLYVYLQKDTDITFLGSVAFSVFGVSGDGFGIGERAGTIQNAALKNIKWVSGELRTNLYLGTLGVTLEKTDVTTDKESYFLGETVKLTAAAAPDEGKAFAYFKVDGKKIEGDTFTITQKNHKVEAHYDKISKLTLGEGITTLDGKTTVGKGATVTLVFNGTAPENKYFKGFKVDDVAITGNTFTATANNHSVTAEFADKVALGNVQLNDIQGGKKQNNDSAKLEFVTDKKYDHSDGDVKDNGSLKVTGSGADLYIYTETALGSLDLSNYKEVYFYVWAQSAGAKAGTWWCNDTALAAGTWTKISVYKNANSNVNGGNPYDADGVNGKLFAADSMGSNFIFRIINGQNNTFYITSLYGVPFPDVEVTVDDAVKDYVSVTGSHKVDQVLTLSVDGAPEHKAFKCFTVNNQELAPDATTYKIKESDLNGVTIGAVFTDASDITFENGAGAEGGITRFGRGVKVKLTHAAATEGKVFDYYLLDDTTKLYDDTFTTSAATHTVKAVYAESPSAITWGDTARYNLSDVKASDAQTSAWFDSKFSDGQIFGSAEYWSIKVNVKFTREWNSVTFVTGSKEALLMRWHSNDKYFAFCKLDQDGNENANSGAPLAPPYLGNDAYNSLTSEQKAFRKMMHGKLAVGTDITVVRYGNTIRVFADNAEVLKITNVIDCTGNWFGISTGFDTDKPETKDIKFITGKEKVDAYLQTAGVIVAPGGLDGSVVEYTSADRTYTVPAFTVKNLEGATIATPVNVAITDAQGNPLTKGADGKITLPDYAGAQAITLTCTADGCPTLTVKVNLQRSDSDVLMTPGDFGVATINANGNTVAYSTEQNHGTDLGSIKVTITGNETGIFLNKSDSKRFIEFYAYSTADNVKSGGWWCCDTPLTKNVWTRVIIDKTAKNYDVHNDEIVIRLFGGASGNVIYISSVRTFGESEQGSATRLNNIATAVNHDGNALVDRSTIATNLDDSAVTEDKILKVTPTKNEFALKVYETFVSSLEDYESVYFWVYTEDSGLQGGTYWCGNTELTQNGWTKVTITRDTNWRWDGGEKHDGVPTGVGGNPYEVGPQAFVYRLMYGDGSKTFYVTSLYGTPKTAPTT